MISITYIEHHVSLSQTQVSLSHAWAGAGDGLILHVVHVLQAIYPTPNAMSLTLSLS
jgi:hypothetical protein